MVKFGKWYDRKKIIEELREDNTERTENKDDEESDEDLNHNSRLDDRKMVSYNHRN